MGNVNDVRNVNLPGTGQSVVSGRNPLLPVCAPNKNVLVNSQTSHDYFVKHNFEKKETITT